MHKTVSIIILLGLTCAIFSGCGETMNGVVKDTKRIGSGIKQVFIRE